MWVNPFWMGVLVTLVVEIVIVFIVTYIGIKLEEAEEEDDARHS